jgi:ubiquitin-conjugating enzyme E2 Z
MNKRVLRDIKLLYNEPLTDIGIHHISNENDMNNLKVLMIGPKDTPYDGGFFFFNITFPDEYPMLPPVIKFCTLNAHVRFNPNLYNCGKVCLSIINTWSGPGWSPCNDIASILRIIMSMVFTEYPLRNEPGFDNKSIDVLNQYNDVIYHEVYRIAIIEVLQKIPEGFDDFIPIINNYFVNNYDMYIKNAVKLKEQYNSIHVKSPIYNMRFKCNYDYIIYKLNNLYSNFNNVNSIIENNNDDIVNKKTKNTPDSVAKIHEVGYTELSNNDNSVYEVKLRKNGIHYWSKK